MAIATALRRLGIAPTQQHGGRFAALHDLLLNVQVLSPADHLFSECLVGSPVRRQLRMLTPEIGGLKRVLLMRKDDLRPEVHTVAAFLKGTVELGKAA